VPEDSASVANALMQAMVLRSQRPRAQGIFDFGDGGSKADAEWRDAEENAKRSRTRYAQAALKPTEVLPEWQGMRALNGGPDEVQRFTRRALDRVHKGSIGETQHGFRIHYDLLPTQLRERLAVRGLTGTRAITFQDDLQPDVAHIGRTHPLVATLAENISEGALDPDGRPGGAPLGRAGAWRTRAVSRMTTVLLMRLRFTLVTSGRTNRTLLAEEATALGFAGTDRTAGLAGAEALALLEAEASGNLAREIIERRVSEALERICGYGEAVQSCAADQAAALSYDHQRVTEAAQGGTTTVVSPVLPADIIGLYVLVPELG
jgi:hypothetical protein